MFNLYGLSPFSVFVGIVIYVAALLAALGQWNHWQECVVHHLYECVSLVYLKCMHKTYKTGTEVTQGIFQVFNPLCPYISPVSNLWDIQGTGQDRSYCSTR